MEFVSVIIPCFNEQKTIAALLESLRLQTYPLNEFEVIIADGLSTDDTRQVVLQYQSTHPEMTIRLIDNPPRNIPSALNRAISVAHGSIIVRLDAHSKPAADYIEKSVQGLQQGKGQNIGGVWKILPGAHTWQAQAIAAAAAHRLGVGDALYRYTRTAGAVDTVPFGAFYKNLVEQVGPFDETLLTNEDYEFNTRIRQAGGVIWLDPTIQSQYYARSTFTALAKQYWRYGYWKLRMLTRYPATIRWRQALPPAFVLSLVILLTLSLFSSLARTLLLLQGTLYAVVLFLAGATTAIKQKNVALLAGLPCAIATMHLAWGSGFLFSLAQWLTEKK